MTTEPPATSTGGAAPPSRSAIKAMTRVHVFLNRLTGGRLFNSIRGVDVCFVTMTRARSRGTLTIPVMYVPYREGVLLVASLGGAPRSPAWYHNLVKHPEIEVRYRGRRMKLSARLAEPEEKSKLWPICDQHYAPYADYRKRTARDIPIFVCEPPP